MNKNLKDRADKLLQSVYLDGYDHGYKDALKSLSNKTWHWIGIDEDYECDNCGFIHTFIDGHTAQYNFCPNCGARMAGSEAHE